MVKVPVLMQQLMSDCFDTARVILVVYISDLDFINHILQTLLILSYIAYTLIKIKVLVKSKNQPTEDTDEKDDNKPSRSSI